jgi:hypothetical protein
MNAAPAYVSHPLALSDPKMKARLANLGGTVLPGSPAEFGKHIAAETEFMPSHTFRACAGFAARKLLMCLRLAALRGVTSTLPRVGSPLSWQAIGLFEA